MGQCEDDLARKDQERKRLSTSVVLVTLSNELFRQFERTYFR